MQSSNFNFIIIYKYMYIFKSIHLPMYIKFIPFTFKYVPSHCDKSLISSLCYCLQKADMIWKIRCH